MASKPKLKSSMSSFWIAFMDLLLLMGNSGFCCCCCSCCCIALLSLGKSNLSLDTDFKGCLGPCGFIAGLFSRLLNCWSEQAGLATDVEYFLSNELGTLLDSRLLEPKVGNFETASDTKSALASFCCWKKAFIFLMEGRRRSGLVSDDSELPSLLEELDFLLFGDDFLEVDGVLFSCKVRFWTFFKNNHKKRVILYPCFQNLVIEYKKM